MVTFFLTLRLRLRSSHIKEDPNVIRHPKAAGTRSVNLNNLMMENKIVNVNAGGKVFKTTFATLLRIGWEPWALNPTNGEVFVDADPKCFAAILQYGRTGILPQEAFELKSAMATAKMLGCNYLAMLLREKLLKSSSYSGGASAEEEDGSWSFQEWDQASKSVSSSSFGVVTESANVSLGHYFDRPSFEAPREEGQNAPPNSAVTEGGRTFFVFENTRKKTSDCDPMPSHAQSNHCVIDFKNDPYLSFGDVV
jgi:hypothetical protein